MLIYTSWICCPSLITILAFNNICLLFAAGLPFWFQMKIQFPPCHGFIPTTILASDTELLYKPSLVKCCPPSRQLTAHCHWIALLIEKKPVEDRRHPSFCHLHWIEFRNWSIFCVICFNCVLLSNNYTIRNNSKAMTVQPFIFCVSFKK